MRFAIPRETAREHRLPMLYSCIVRACARYGGVEFDERCQGAVCWLQDRHFPLGLAHLGNRDLFLILSTLRPCAFWRLARHELPIERQMAAVAGGRFACLWIMGVDPAAQGQGLGALLVRRALERMKERGFDSCILKTENERNVAFYRRIGFELIEAGRAPSSGLAYWILATRLTASQSAKGESLGKAELFQPAAHNRPPIDRGLRYSGRHEEPLAALPT